jgi:hypothetical protein
MTYKELAQHIIDLGFDITYGSYAKAPELPYTVIVEANSNDFVADDYNYVKIRNHQLELYTEGKDIDSEKLIEDKLDELKMPYMKISKEIKPGFYQVIYEIQLIGG